MAKNPKAEVELGLVARVEKGLKDAENQIKAFGNRLTSIFGFWVSGIAKVATAVAAAGAAVIAFGGFAIREFGNAQKEVARLGAALRNAGLDAGGLQPEVEKVVKSLAKLTGKDGGDITDTFSRLMSLTNDYTTSLKALPLALDIAASSGKSLESTTELLARALRGEQGALKQLGIELKEHQTPLDAIRERYAGFAAGEGKTVHGLLGRIKEAWNNLLETVGRIITSNGKFEETGNKVVGVLERWEAWFEDNKDDIATAVDNFWNLAQAIGELSAAITKMPFKKWAAMWDVAIGGAQFDVSQYIRGARRLKEIAEEEERGPVAPPMTTVVVDAAEEAAERLRQLRAQEEADRIAQQKEQERLAELARKQAEDAAKAEKEARKAEEERIRLLIEASSQASFRKGVLPELAKVEDDLTRRLREGNLDLAERVRLTKLLNEVKVARGADSFAIDPSREKIDVKAAKHVPEVAPQGAKEKSGPGAFMSDVGNAMGEWSQEQIDSIDLVRGSVEALGDAFLSAFAAIGSGEPVFKSLGKAAKAMIADVARMAAREQMAKGAAKLAEAIFGHPTAGPSAAQHFAAAAMFSALAGMAGGSGGGGRGRGPGSGHGGGGMGRDRDAFNDGRGPAQIVIEGGFLDMNNPEQADRLAKAIEQLSGRRVIVMGN